MGDLGSVNFDVSSTHTANFASDGVAEERKYEVSEHILSITMSLNAITYVKLYSSFNDGDGKAYVNMDIKITHDHGGIDSYESRFQLY